MYYFILDKVSINQKKIDNIEKSLIHIYCILLCIVSLIMFIQLS